MSSYECFGVDFAFEYGFDLPMFGVIMHCCAFISQIQNVVKSLSPAFETANYHIPLDHYNLNSFCQLVHSPCMLMFKIVQLKCKSILLIFVIHSILTYILGDKNLSTLA